MTEESKTMNIYEKLMNIQYRLNAPKNMYNSFGNYSYRSCESILEAVKPLAYEYGCIVNIDDNIFSEGDRIYVQAVATIRDVITGESVSVASQAREAESKKGMDASQVTGATSSYARKYALNGLFAIDDSKDADTNELRDEAKAREKHQSKQSDPKVGKEQIELLKGLAEEKNISIALICETFNVGTLQDLTMSMWTQATKMLENTKGSAA